MATECLTIIDSFDPNDKQVSPKGLTEERFVKRNTPLDYKIRFQNTGTDTAYTVIVVDTLSSLFDISSLQMKGASHNYSLSVSGKENPILTWTFNSINLVDSLTDEPNSHGFLKFAIEPIEGLQDGTIVHNTASIYFDYNEPVITNDAWINYHDTILVTDNYVFANDIDLPIPFLSTGVGEYTNQAFNLNIAINEDASILSQDVTATNATISNLQGQLMNYTALVEPTQEGEVLVVMEKGSFNDLNGNKNISSNTLKVVYDNTPPSLDLMYSDAEPFIVELQLTEPVEGELTLSDFSITGNTITDLRKDGNSYVLSLAYQLGAVSISIDADKLVDRAGNFNQRIEKTFTINSVESNQYSALTHVFPNPAVANLLVEFPWAGMAKRKCK